MFFVFSKVYLDNNDSKKLKKFLKDNSFKFFLLSKKNDNFFLKKIKKIVSGNVFIIKSDINFNDFDFLNKIKLDLNKINILENIFKNKLFLLFFIYDTKFNFQKKNLVSYNKYMNFFNTKSNSSNNSILTINIKFLIKILNKLFIVNNNELIRKFFIYCIIYNNHIIKYN